MRTRVMPWASPGLWLRQAVPARFDVQPAPPGMMASSMEPPCASVSRTRAPLAAGSIGGVVGTAILPFIRSTLLAGRLRCRTLIPALVAKTGTMLVHESHASPMPSWSLSACVGFASVRQLSSRSQTPSPSLSVARTSAGQLALVPLHCSAGSQAPVEARQMVVAGWKASGGQATAEPSQVSARSHTSAAARQTLPAGCTASAGQSSCTPSQLSATSHTPAAARHTAVPLASAGHAALVPPQLSATSHTPAAGRHATVAGWKASAGQSLLSPSQLSATSHGPAAARHTAVLLASAGQAALVPVQVSAASQAPAAARHSTVAGWKVSPEQSLLTPSQLSATSHGPAAARHTAVLFPSAGQSALVPVQLSATSQTPAAARHSTVAGSKAAAGQALLTPSQL